MIVRCRNEYSGTYRSLCCFDFVDIYINFFGQNTLDLRNLSNTSTFIRLLSTMSTRRIRLLHPHEKRHQVTCHQRPREGERRRRAPPTTNAPSSPATARPEQDRPVVAEASYGLSGRPQGRGPRRTGAPAARTTTARSRRSRARAVRTWVRAWRSRIDRAPRAAVRWA